MNDTVFRQRLSSVMTDNMYDRHLKGRTRGKLDMRSLHKVATGSKNVFTQKLAKQGKQYNIVLLVDESGSMGHGWGAYKIGHAADVARFLVEQFEGVNIDVAVIGFNGRNVTFKEFGQTIPNYQEFRDSVERMAIENVPNPANGGTSYLSCGHDYDALELAYKKLYGKKGTSLVIALSDGKPNCDYNNSHYDSGKHNFNKIRALIEENKRIAKTIGIGILYEATQFPTNIVTHNLDDLKPAVVNVLKKEIKRQ